MGFVDDILNKIKNKQESPALKNDEENVAARIAQADQEADLKFKQMFIVCNGKSVPIEWPKVVLWTDPNGLGYTENKNCYKEQVSRQPQMFVAHWDVCLSTKSMVQVTKDRGLSVHFGIDNDGTIYQLLDTKDIAWHALGVNNVSVGVEISNGIDPKYQDYYTKAGFGERRVILNDSVHNKVISPYLDFYPIQIQAYKALMRALHVAHNIPYQVPLDSGNLLRGVSDEVVKCTFKGMIGHYHVTTNKIDPGHLPIDQIARDLDVEEKVSKVQS